jgi:N-acetylglucosaminyl-diphospho-decaprenol L-rhamnosyltransferase
MVDIVLVNWNSGNFLRKCLDSVFSTNNLQIIHRIFIIDNNSADGSAGDLPASEKIVVVQNTENLGFSKACNQGFRLCTAAFVLLLNPDTMLFESTLSDCANFLQQNEDVDILGCSLLDDDGKISKSCSRFPTPLTLFYDATGLSKISPRLFKPATVMTDWDHSESRPVDQVMGAFMFMRTGIFQKNGYFDERFFVYYEELDFSKRLAEIGGKSYYHSGIKAIHSGEGTTTGVKAFRLFLNLKSRLQYAKKHFSYGGYVLVCIGTFVPEPFLRMLQLIIKGNVRDAGNVIKGYWLLIRSLPIK